MQLGRGRAGKRSGRAGRPGRRRRSPRRPPAAPPLCAALSAAVCALLGSHASPARASQTDAGLLFYSEFDRVSLLESDVRLKSPMGARSSFSMRMVFDVLTGASPNGALPARRPQTFTHPSGTGDYRVEPGALPLDHIFQDSRFAFTNGVDLPLGPLSRVTFATGLSVEYDYRSITADGSLSRDFNRRNTSLTLAASLAKDEIGPEGGIPISFAPMKHVGIHPPRLGDSMDKTVADAVLSATQILDRSTLMQANYSFSRATGYQTDPFKVITVFDDAPGTNLGQPVEYLFEKRPDRRTKQAVYGKIKRHLARDIVDLSYRYLWDDWGLVSHTVETHYRLETGHPAYLEAHLRYYHQTAVDFYTCSLAASAPLPAFATADYRQGAMNAVTVGLGYGREREGRDSFSARLEYYLQMADGHPESAVGAQKGLDLVPDLGALIGQFTWSFDWW